MGYTTITVKRETWELLSKVKGNRSWDEFLEELVRLRTKRLNDVLRELGKELDEDLVEPVSEW